MNPSECHEALSTLFDEWLDPSLDETRRRAVQSEVERILAACPEGEREWRGLLELGATLHEMPVAAVPTRVRSNVNAMLHAEAAPRKRSWSLNSFVWAGSASFVVLALLVIAYPLRFQPSTYQAPAIQQEPEALSESTAPTSETTPKGPGPIAESAKKPESASKQPAKNGGATSKRNQNALDQNAGSSVKTSAASKAKRNKTSGSSGASTANSDAALEAASATQSQAAPPATVRAVPLPPAPARAEESQVSKRLGGQSSPRRSAATPRATQTPSLAATKRIETLPSKESTPQRSTSVSPDREANRQSASILSLPSPKRATAKPAPSTMRFRTAPLDATALSDNTRQDSGKDWEETQVTFTVISLPASPSVPAQMSESRAMTPASKGQQPQGLRVRPGFVPAPSMSRRALDARQDAGGAKPAEARSATANGGEANAGTMQALPVAPLPSASQLPSVGRAGFAPPVAPSTTVPQTIAPPAPAIAAAPMVAAPSNQNAASGPRVFQVPTNTLRRFRFRVTVQAPRFLGPAQARLEGSKTGTQSAPIWKGTLEAQTPVTFEVEAGVAPGESLNLVLEQIRPNGESGEQKTFPLVRP